VFNNLDDFESWFDFSAVVSSDAGQSENVSREIMEAVRSPHVPLLVFRDHAGGRPLPHAPSLPPCSTALASRSDNVVGRTRVFPTGVLCVLRAVCAPCCVCFVLCRGAPLRSATNWMLPRRRRRTAW
jgi:hypothetical protein